MPILGILASGISGHLTPPWSPEGAYDALAAVTLSTATSSVTFIGIPSGYKHLQVRHIARTTNSSTNGNMYIQLNGDTGANYAWHRLEGAGTGTVGSLGIANASAFAVGGLMTGAQSITSSYGVGILDILDYGSTKYKTMKTLTGYENNGNGSPGNDQGYINFNSSVWMSSNAVSSIGITINGGGNFAQHSQFALYGVK